MLELGTVSKLCELDLSEREGLYGLRSSVIYIGASPCRAVINNNLKPILSFTGKGSRADNFTE